MQENLFDQTTQLTRSAMAMLLGFNSADFAGFRNILREIPALPEGWTVGDATNAYLRHMISKFSA